MRFASLGSGSRGNATLVQHGDTCVLVDCGFTLRETEIRLARLGIDGNALDAVLVTHEHGDHIRGVGPLARKFGVPVYLTHGTYRQSRIGQVRDLIKINSHDSFAVKGLQVQPVPVPHDASEPCQFIFSNGAKKLGVLTDLGSITPFVQQSYCGLDALLLECNHDAEMLEKGPYPYSLKRRIGGDYGHLSNFQAAGLLREIGVGQLQHLVISHISEQNNRAELAATAVADALGCQQDWLTVADQQLGFSWRALS